MLLDLNVCMNHQQQERHENRNKNVFGFCVFSVFRGLPRVKLQNIQSHSDIS